MIRMRVLSKGTGLVATMALFLTALTPIVASAADPDKGPIWRSWHARINEGKKDDYVRYIVKVYHLKLVAWKEAGLITDYMVLLNDPQGPDDPDVTFMYQQANMATLDLSGKEWEKIGDKAVEKLKDDPEAQKMIAEYHSWRKFTGWSPIAREVVWAK